VIRSLAQNQFVRFVLTGGLAAAVNFGSRIVINQWFDFSTSVILAYLLGMGTAFALARMFVFTKSAHSVQKSALLFTLINVFAIAQTWLISTVFAFHVLPAMGWGWHPHEVAHALGVIAPVFSSYIGHKHLSFKTA
jgi:putative flippase GtrA